MASPASDPLYGVWGSSANDVFAVGGDEGIILHYNGTAWTEMASPASDGLYEVWGSSTNDVFAVGVSISTRAVYYIIYHYDGTAWTEMASPTSDPLYGVWGSSGNDVFVVGSLLGGRNPDGLLVPDKGTILHYTKDMIPFEDSDTIETIREKIDANNYDFTVEHNWVFDMTKEEKEKFFVVLPPPETPFLEESQDVSRKARKSLPTQFDWRNHNGRSYIGPVRNQGQCGSCYAFATCAAAEGAYNLANNKYDAECADFSESFIAFCLPELKDYNKYILRCEGGYTNKVLKILLTEGVRNENELPYTPFPPGSCSYNNTMSPFKDARRVGCNDIERIKEVIMTYGVVKASVYASSAFEAYSGGIYEDQLKSCSASPCQYSDMNHAAALVGWNDDEECWILRNSWGTDWGEQGYMRIKYNSAHVGCSVAYLVTDDDADEDDVIIDDDGGSDDDGGGGCFISTTVRN